MFKKVIVATALLVVCFISKGQAENDLKFEDITLHVGNHILSQAPTGVNSSQFEYGIGTELKVKHWNNWRVETSISKSFSSGSKLLSESSQSCTTVTGVRYGDDNHSTSQSHTHTVCNTIDLVDFSSSSSSLDLWTFDFGVTRHWHIHKHIETSAGIGVNIVNANLKVGGRSDSDSVVGAYASTGIQLEEQKFLFGVNLKVSTDPVNLMNDRVDVGGMSIQASIGKSF